MDKHCLHSIKTKPPLNIGEIMRTEQPNTISIDGVEIPTMTKLFSIQQELDRHSKRETAILVAICVIAAAIIILGLK